MKADDYIDLFNIDSKCYSKTYDIIEYMLNDFKEEKKAIFRYLESRSCENCKHYKQSSSQDYKSCYEIKINGFNFESEKDFCCKYWELK